MPYCICAFCPSKKGGWDQEEDTRKRGHFSYTGNSLSQYLKKQNHYLWYKTDRVRLQLENDLVPSLDLPFACDSVMT